MQDDKSVWKREPAQLLGGIFGVIGFVVTLVMTAIADLPPDAGWLNVAIVVASVVLPIVQGKATRENVYSPATYEQDQGTT